MLTGSLASSLQGVPRASHDVDLVIDPDDDEAGAAAGRAPASPATRVWSRLRTPAAAASSGRR
jgi:hypothetical protein